MYRVVLEEIDELKLKLATGIQICLKQPRNSGVAALNVSWLREVLFCWVMWAECLPEACSVLRVPFSSWEE